MADDADALQPEQRRAAVFGVVEPLLEVGESLARSRNPTWRVMVACNDSFSMDAYGRNHPFGDLQRDVAHKTIANDDIGLAVVQVAAFHVADKVQRQRLE